MATTTRTLCQSWSISWTRRAYHEDHWKPSEEPRRRRLPIIAHSSHMQWHIAITFEGSLHSDRISRANITQRREDFEDLCSCLDFENLQLLDDTVTELLIKRKDDTTPPYYDEDEIVVPKRSLPLRKKPLAESEYHSVSADLRLYVREDPFRVRFPPLDCTTGVPTVEYSRITTIRELSAGVHEVRITGHAGSYVFKEVDRPLYNPRDSAVLDQELENLEKFRGVENVAQLIAAIVSSNPYQTSQASKTDSHKETDFTKTVDIHDSVFLRGILLEYYPNGTLEEMLKNAQNASLSVARPWLKWAFQIANALACLHGRGVAHMDIKPSNILISATDDAVITDVSGVGGVTREWLAPEMLDMLDPLSESMGSRMRNDIWALGSLLLQMANAACIGKEQLHCIGISATVENPSLRPSAQSLVSNLIELGTGRALERGEDNEIEPKCQVFGRVCTTILKTPQDMQFSYLPLSKP
ncbi:kinase-like protein [Pseudovirgaria hyperparasitica]|uniref:Kinase-like protein n=1 Tax=Pseudovirgaria hyperparasitica TaxID=470096 RepID=A0A6A6WGM9_9PEZI|nr:kinase-like protein [Pseudovirgaria hyperparasitica]KAF2761255.1 kinase-like protein [Pseudovirgaria hyperparasitica]